MLDGCSGSTVDTSAHKSSLAATQANQQRELEKVVQCYNMILENTADEEDFSQYRLSMERTKSGSTRALIRNPSVTHDPSRNEAANDMRYHSQSIE